MSTTCVYATRQAPSCPAPATHRVVKGWLRPWSHWRVEEGAGDDRAGGQPPVFCLRHAEEVMDQRQRTARDRSGT